MLPVAHVHAAQQRLRTSSKAHTCPPCRPSRRSCPPAMPRPSSRRSAPFWSLCRGCEVGAYAAGSASTRRPAALTHFSRSPHMPPMPSEPAIMPSGDPPAPEPPIGALLEPLQAGRMSSDGANRWSLWVVCVLLSWFRDRTTHPRTTAHPSDQRGASAGTDRAPYWRVVWDTGNKYAGVYPRVATDSNG